MTDGAQKVDLDEEGTNQREMSKVEEAMWKSMEGARMTPGRGSLIKIEMFR